MQNSGTSERVAVVGMPYQIASTQRPEHVAEAAESSGSEGLQAVARHVKRTERTRSRPDSGGIRQH